MKRQEWARLTRILGHTYRQKECIESDDQWKRELMARVREMGTPRQGAFLPMFEQLAWRLAPVTCPLAVALAAFLTGFNLTFGYDLAQLLNGQEEFTLARLFGF